LDFRKATILLGNRMANALPQFLLAATNKITLGYLNSNLMAPKMQPPTVTFDGNSREADNVSVCAQ
jgi:hypothetical protein